MIITINGEPREASPDEIQKYNGMAVEDLPTQIDTIEAQVLYTAMMTNTLLEEGRKCLNV